VSTRAAELSVGVLDERDRSTLERLAVARSITLDVAKVVLRGVEQLEPLEDLPLLRKASWDESGQTFLLDPNVRTVLLEGAGDVVTRSRLHSDLVEYYEATGNELNALFHRLSGDSARAQALDELEARFDACLKAFDVTKAHDLLRLLEEANVGRDRLEQMRPRLARRARWLRERDITTSYFKRSFEGKVWETLRHDQQRWILQLHAPGGMGKTMFVSNFVGRVCPSEELPTAKIDFDYVANLVQATFQPWRLLLLLARQLSDQLVGNPFRKLLDEWGRYESIVVSARRREDLPVPRVDIEDARAAAEVPLLFTNILAEVCRAAPVVVVLDTVENLLHADDLTAMDVLQELSKVHQRVPSLRLVLAGRFDLSGQRQTGKSETAPRVPGFREAYVGRSRNGKIEEADAVWGEQCLTVAVPAFDPANAAAYLHARGVSDAAYVATIVALAEGNPLKLALFADEVTSDNPPSVEELKRVRHIELHHLVKRVIDRIADPYVQWLVRWGTIPFALERDFAQDVLWPLLGEQLQGSYAWDAPELDQLARLGRGSARYDVGKLPADFDHAWGRLASYASARSWINSAPDLPNAFVFHPETRDPMRGILRAQDRDIYRAMHREALAYWRKLAGTLTGAGKLAALRAVVFHLFEPWEGRPDPAKALAEVLAQVGDDAELRAALAAEVLDVERRANRRDREDLEPPAPPTIALAHREIALAAVAAAERGQGSSAQLERHLDASDLPPGACAALRARLAVVQGRDAQRWLEAALARRDELDASTSSWVALTYARLKRDVTALRKLRAELPENTSEWKDATSALAGELLRREQLPEALHVCQRADDRVGVARAFLGMGQLAQALSALEHESSERARIVSAEVRLALYRPEEVLSDTRLRSIEGRDGLPSGAALVARANAMLGRQEVGLENLESLVAQDALGSDVDAPTAARIYLDSGDPGRALRILDTLESDPSPEVHATTLLLRIEALHQQGRSAAASGLLESFQTRNLPISVQVSALLLNARVSGFEHVLSRLVELLAAVPSSSWRLALLEGLARVKMPYPRLASRAADELDLLTTPEHASIPLRLLLARVDVLRVLGRTTSASQLLREAGSGAEGVGQDFCQAAELRMSEAVFSHGLDRAISVASLDDDDSELIDPSDEALPFPWKAVLKSDEAFPEAALGALLMDWRGACDALGHYLQAHRKSEELVIGLGEPERAWIPWQIATARGAPIPRIRRTCAGDDVRGPIKGPILLVNEFHETADVTARAVRAAWRDEVGPVEAMKGLAWSSWESILRSGPKIVHVVGSFEQRRGGSIFLNLTAHRQEATGVSHLGRALSHSGSALLILHSPWPGSTTEAARQLMLRERFAWELFQAQPRTNVLCVGLMEPQAGPDSYCDELVRSIVSSPLKDVVARLQHGEPAPTLAQRLGSAATLYSQSPARRYEP
jgi:hypothetical protein